MFCVVVINKQKYSFERKKWNPSSQKVYLGENIENMFKHARIQQKIYWFFLLRNVTFKIIFCAGS